MDSRKTEVNKMKKVLCISSNKTNTLTIGNIYFIGNEFKLEDNCYVEVWLAEPAIYIGRFNKEHFVDFVSESQAKEFYRDLCSTVYGDCNKNSQGIMSAEMIADYMKISIERANDFLWACARYGITERQGGAWIV